MPKGVYVRSDIHKNNLRKTLAHARLYVKPVSEETRAKLVAAQRRRRLIPVTQEFRDKMSYLNSGKKHPMYGRRGKQHHMYGKCGVLSTRFGVRLSPETILKMKAVWQRPGYKDRILSKALKHGCARPNNFEASAMLYLNAQFPGKFIYAGDGTKIVSGRSADAYSDELKTVALFHGVYWHLKKFGLQITRENKQMVETRDSLPFISAGYKVIVIWEDTLKEMKVVPT